MADTKMNMEQIATKLGELKLEDEQKINKIISTLMACSNSQYLFGKTVEEFIYYYLSRDRYIIAPRCMLTSNKQSDIDNIYILNSLLTRYGFQSLVFEYFNDIPCAGFIGLDVNSIAGLYSHINFCRRCVVHIDPDLKNRFIPSNGIINCETCGGDFMQQVML